MISGILAWLSKPTTAWPPPIRRLVLASFVLANFLVFVAIAYGYGPSMTPDGHRDHALGVLLIESGFDLNFEGEEVATLRHRYEMVQSPLPYFLYHSLLGIAHLIAGENWLNLWVLINSIGQTAITGTLLLLVSRQFQSRAAFLGMGVMTIGCWEYLQWISHSQSDTLFGLLVLLAFLLVHRQWISESARSSMAWAFVAILVTIAAGFFRPTAAPLIAFVSIAILWGLATVSKDIDGKAWMLRRWLPVLTAVLLATIPVLVLILYDPGLAPEGSIRDSFAFYHERAALGMIVWYRPEYTISAPQGYGEYLLISICRLFYYFLFVAKGFSTSHNIINILFFVPFYGFAAAGIWQVMRKSSNISSRVRLVGLFAIGLIILFDVLHAVTLVDFDWRYRAPVYPALFLLAAIGIECATLAYSDRQHIRDVDHR